MDGFNGIVTFLLVKEVRASRDAWRRNRQRANHQLRNGDGHGNGYDHDCRGSTATWWLHHDCCGSTTAAITTLTMVMIAAAMTTIAEPMRALDRHSPRNTHPTTDLRAPIRYMGASRLYVDSAGFGQNPRENHGRIRRKS